MQLRFARTFQLLSLLGLCLTASCDSTAPSATVPLKRGASVRVINLTDTPLTARFGSQPVSAVGVDRDDAPFILTSPKHKELTVENGSSATPLRANLVAEETHTLVLQGNASKLALRQLDGDQLRGMSGPTIRIHNLTSSPLTAKASTATFDLKPGESSSESPLQMEAFALRGRAGSKAFSSNEMTPVADGAYMGLVYESKGKIHAKLFYTNPPMMVAGSPR